MFGTAEFIDDKEDIPGIHDDAAVDIFSVVVIADDALPGSVEEETGELSVGIENGASGVAAGGMAG